MKSSWLRRLQEEWSTICYENMSLIVGLCQFYERFLVLSQYNDSYGSKKNDSVFFFEICTSRKFMIETLMEEVMQFFLRKMGLSSKMRLC